MYFRDKKKTQSKLSFWWRDNKHNGNLFYLCRHMSDSGGPTDPDPGDTEATKKLKFFADYQQAYSEEIFKFFEKNCYCGAPEQWKKHVEKWTRDTTGLYNKSNAI